MSLHQQQEATTLFDLNKTSLCTLTNYVLNENTFFVSEVAGDKIVFSKECPQRELFKQLNICQLLVNSKRFTLECVNSVMSPTDGMWEYVPDADSRLPPPIEGQEIYKIGRQTVTANLFDFVKL